MRNPRLLLLGIPALLAFAVQVRQAQRAQSESPARSASAARAPQAGPSARPIVVLPPAAPEPGAVLAHRLDESGIYLEDQLLVAPRAGEDLAAIAAAIGAEVLSEPGASGYGVLLLAGDREAAAEALLGDPRVADLARNAVIYGAGGSSGSGSGGSSASNSGSGSAASGGSGSATAATGAASSARANRYQWHLDAARAPANAGKDLSGWVVAVLDSGVAYTSAPGSAAAPSLAQVPVVAPLDLVDGDDLPLDEHWHGTHIASIIASKGSVEGVAPGVTLMPVRVLDERNSGTEAGLIEGIHHAIDNGADVINMSLSFPIGYAPSRALRQALQAASDAGIVLVAAAGNSAEDLSSWPAASPLVVGVGASRPLSTYKAQVADYSNLSAELDLMAPGGQMSADFNRDGYGDGILAETIFPGDPSRVGQFFAVGTSQAAAVVSGAAAQLLAAGVPPEQVPAALQKGATSWGATSYSSGYGAGALDVSTSLTAAATLPPLAERHASVLPHLGRRSSGEIRPQARVQVVDGAGKAVSGALVVGTLSSASGSQPVSCTLAVEGACTLAGSWVAESAAGQAWAFSVDAVVDSATLIATRPEAVFFASDALEILLAAAGQDPALDDALLAFSWKQGKDADLGDIAAGYTLLNLGSGLSSSPLGLVFTSSALKASSVEVISVNLDGSGLSSSPLGMLSLSKITLSGSGLSSSTLGLRSVSLMTLDGSGLSSSTLGLKATTLTSPSLTTSTLGSSYDSPLLALNGGAIFQVDGSSTAPLAGTRLGALVESGGWTSADGYDAATLGAAAGAVSVTLSAGQAAGSSDEASAPVLLAP